MDLDLPTSAVDLAFSVRNGDAEPHEVAMSIAGLGHDLQGTPQYLVDAPAASLLAVSPSRVVLGPQQAVDVRVAGQLERDAPGFAAALLVEIVSDAPEASVTARTRVAGLLLLRGPKPWNESLEITGVGAVETADPATVELFVEIAATGDVHVRPTGRITMTGAAGEALGAVDVEPANIVNGFARRLVGTWPLPRGYTGPVRLAARVQPGDLSGSGDVVLANGVVTDALPRAPGQAEPTGPVGSFIPPGAERSRAPLIAIATVLLVAVAAAAVLHQRRARDGAAPTG